MSKKIKAARVASGKTQAQVAKEAGISERGYQKIEAKGTYKAVQTAIRIARALNITVEDLFAEEKPDGNPAEENTLST